MQRLTKALGVSAILVIVAVAAASFWGSLVLDEPLPIPAAGTTYTIESGSSLGAIARDLNANGFLPNPRVFVLYSRLRDLTGRMRAGEYWLTEGETIRSLLTLFVSGDVVLHEFTIIEGWTVTQLLGAMAADPVLEQTLDPMIEPGELSRQLGLEFEHPEGQFFPDTYFFPRGTSDVGLLKQSAKAMIDRLAQVWAGRDIGLPLETRYEALILASIVERETALDSERPDVAGVFARRLQRGMRLQTDPTVIYGLGRRFDGNLTRSHLDADSPYNTYTRRGLPPTPISLPGMASLEAAVRPGTGDSLYFVATGLGDGSHEFTNDLDAHNAAVRRYLDRLRQKRRQGTKP